jgi:hypothetical protein
MNDKNEQSRHQEESKAVIEVEAELPMEVLLKDALESDDVIHNLVQFFRDHPAILVTLLYAQMSAVGVIYLWSLFRQFGVNVMDFAEANDFLLAAFKEPFSFFAGLVLVIWELLFALVGYALAVRTRSDIARQFFDQIHLVKEARDEEMQKVEEARLERIRAARHDEMEMQEIEEIKEYCDRLIEKFEEASAMETERFRQAIRKLWLRTEHARYRAKLGLVLGLILAATYITAAPYFCGWLDGRRIRAGDGVSVVVELRSSGESPISSKFEDKVFLIGTTDKFVFIYDHQGECTHIVPIASIVDIRTALAESTEVSATPTSEVSGTPTSFPTERPR